LVTANRQNIADAQQNRPVIGLRRRADAAVMPLTITTDSRDAEVRKQEIHSALLAAIDKAAAAGFELVQGADYGLGVTGLDREIDWAQVSNTEVFLYIPYSFTVAK
jgi:hypothetical protein